MSFYTLCEPGLSPVFGNQEFSPPSSPVKVLLISQLVDCLSATFSSPFTKGHTGSLQVTPDQTGALGRPHTPECLNAQN